jgi:hypothetical protein
MKTALRNTTAPGIRAGHIVAAFFFVSVFLFFAGPLKRGDLWWHLATGRWIMEHRELPSEDPFTYTASEGPDVRRTVILKGFWLSQVIYYHIYKLLGFRGLILLKASLFTALFYALQSTVRRGGLPGITALVPIAPLVFLTDRFEEVRPQTFSFLGTILIYNCAEKTLRDLRGGARLGPGLLIPPCLIMLLWSNLHRGFIIGYAVLGVYLLSETIKYVLKKDALERASFGGFLIWSSAPVLASLLNPNHLNTLGVNIRELLHSTSTMTIDEYLSPLKYSSYTGATYFLYGLFALGAVTLLIMAVSWRRLEPSHALLYAGFAAAALNSFRFCIFFIFMSVAVSSRYLAHLLQPWAEPLRRTAAPIILVAALVITAQSYGGSFINKGSLRRSIPVGATDFITRKGLPKNLFNSYEMGNYLIWRLHPRYRVFIDGRAIDNNALIHYMAARLGKYEPVFEATGINTVVFEPFHAITLNVPPIVFSLLKDPKWRLVYLDGTSVIFVRVEAAPSITAINKAVLWDALINTAEMQAGARPESARPLMMLSQIYAARGERRKAAEFLEKAYERTSR